jgi:predicted pyridoxine 5'-phosphate oxidase superfamily flavin-nucleotide-binding protein
MKSYKEILKDITKKLEVKKFCVLATSDEDGNVSPKFPHYCNEAGGTTPNLV